MGCDRVQSARRQTFFQRSSLVDSAMRVCYRVVPPTRLRPSVWTLYFHILRKTLTVIFIVFSDVKPHNFVFRPDGHLLLIDFGSAAPLLPPQDDGVQLIPREYCLIPCGTCDYVSPEILKAHEEALVALEMSDGESDASSIASLRRKRLDSRCETGYGRETDWWSLGAMVYEMTFGVAPFFANDVRHTYTRIMNHEVPFVYALIKGSPCLTN